MRRFRQEVHHCRISPVSWYFCVLCIFLFMSFPALCRAESPTPEVSSAPAVSSTPAVSQAPGMSPQQSESIWQDEENDTSREKRMRDSFYRRIALTLFSLMIVSLIAILVLRYVYARQGFIPGFTQKEKLIRIVERQVLTPQKSLVLVEIAGRYLLLGVSEAKIDYLAEIEGDRIKSEAVEPGAQPPDYREYLERHSFPKPVMFLFSKLLEGKKK